MMYHIKGFIARVLDFFDPDDVSYVVCDDIDPLKLSDHSRQHIRSLINFKL